MNTHVKTQAPPRRKRQRAIDVNPDHPGFESLDVVLVLFVFVLMAVMAVSSIDNTRIPLGEEYVKARMSGRNANNSATTAKLPATRPAAESVESQADRLRHMVEDDVAVVLQEMRQDILNELTGNMEYSFQTALQRPDLTGEGLLMEEQRIAAQDGERARQATRLLIYQDLRENMDRLIEAPIEVIAPGIVIDPEPMYIAADADAARALSTTNKIVAQELTRRINATFQAPLAVDERISQAVHEIPVDVAVDVSGDTYLVQTEFHPPEYD